MTDHNQMKRKIISMEKSISHQSSKKKRNEFHIRFCIPHDTIFHEFRNDYFSVVCIGQLYDNYNEMKSTANPDFGRYILMGKNGILPSMKPYYLYDGVVNEKEDNIRYTGSSYFIVRINTSKKLPIDRHILDFLLKYELNDLPLNIRLEMSEFRSNKDNYDKNGICTKKFENQFKSHLEYIPYWEANVEDFFTRIIRPIHIGKNMSRNEKLKIHAIIIKDPFPYAFRGLTIRSKDVPDDLIILYDQLNIVGEPINNHHIDCIKLYYRLDKLTHNRGHMCFYQTEIRDGDEACLATLISIGAIVRETIFETHIYTLHPEYQIREKFISFITEFIEDNKKSSFDVIKKLSEKNQKLSQFSGLDSIQLGAVLNAINHPISIIMGGAGTGKTQTLQYIYGIIDEYDCVVSSTAACFIKDLQSRGIRHAETTKYYIYHILGKYGEDNNGGNNNTNNNNGNSIHHDIDLDTELDNTNDDNSNDSEDDFKLTPSDDRGDTNKTKGNPVKLTLEKLQMAKVLILDEASMIPYEIFTLLFECFPSLVRIILVFDSCQLQPIQKGAPYEDLMYALPIHCITKLEKNYRTFVNDPQRMKQILNIQRHLRNHLPRAIKFHLSNGISMGLPGFYNIMPSHDNMIKLITTILKPRPPETNTTTTTNKTTSMSDYPFQILTFTRNTSTIYNTLIDTHMERGMNKLGKYYIGQKIMISDINIRYGKRSKEKGIGKFYSELFNGEMFVIEDFKQYNPKTDQLEKIIGSHNSLDIFEWPVFITTTNGKNILIKNDNKHFGKQKVISPENIVPAWAITTNIAQGKQFRGWVIVILPKEEIFHHQGGNDTFYVNNRLFVASTRSRESTVIFGTPKAFRLMGSRKTPPRYSRIGYILKEKIEKIYQK